MVRRPPRSTRTDTLFPTRRSSDLRGPGAGPCRPPARPGRDGTVSGRRLKSRAVFRRPTAGLRRGLLCCFDERRSEEHTSELQSLMRISYAVFCLRKTNMTIRKHERHMIHTSLFMKKNQYKY